MCVHSECPIEWGFHACVCTSSGCQQRMIPALIGSFQIQIAAETPQRFAVVLLLLLHWASGGLSRILGAVLSCMPGNVS